MSPSKYKIYVGGEKKFKQQKFKQVIVIYLH